MMFFGIFLSQSLILSYLLYSTYLLQSEVGLLRLQVKELVSFAKTQQSVALNQPSASLEVKGALYDILYQNSSLIIASVCTLIVLGVVYTLIPSFPDTGLQRLASGVERTSATASDGANSVIDGAGFSGSALTSFLTPVNSLASGNAFGLSPQLNSLTIGGMISDTGDGILMITNQPLSQPVGEINISSAECVVNARRVAQVAYDFFSQNPDQFM